MNCFPITIAMTRPKLVRHVIAFLFATVPAHAQSSPPPPSYLQLYSTSSFSLTMAFVLTFIILVFVMISLASFCINRYALNDTDQQPNQPPRVSTGTVGLDRSLVEMFPVIDYVGIKGIKIGNGPLECAVCLSQFEDSDKIRLLLPGCCHAFQPECIDVWLQTHVTCPVCRSDLTHNAELFVRENNFPSVRGEQHLAIAAVDRFTLRLPEHVQRDIEASRGEHRLAARIGGHQYEVLPVSKSGKVWSFLRVFSSRKPTDEVGEGSFIREVSVRREASVGIVAPFANFHSASLRAEHSVESIGRLSPVTAPRTPFPMDTGTIYPATTSESSTHRSTSIKLSQEIVAIWNSAPSSPSQGENTTNDSIKLSPRGVITGRSYVLSSLLQGGNREYNRDAA